MMAPNEGTVASIEYANQWRVYNVALKALNDVGFNTPSGFNDTNWQQAAHLIQHIAAHAAGKNGGGLWASILREIAEGIEVN